MNKMRFFTSLMFLGLTLLLIAQQNPDINKQMVSSSDLIVVGTVTKIQETALSLTADAAEMGLWGTKTNSLSGVTKLITVSVEEALKGNVISKEMTLAVTLLANQNAEWLPKVGDTDIFYVQRNKSGNTLTYGKQGIQPLAQIDDIEKTIKSVPLSVELPPFQSPLFFGKPAQLSLKVTNITDSPLTLRNFSLQGFYYANRMESFINISTQLADALVEPGKPIIPATLTIAGKQTMEIKLIVSPRVPQSMTLLGADSYMMTIAALYANVNYATEADKTRVYVSRSNWNDAFLGFSFENEPLQTEDDGDIVKEK